MLVEGNPVSDNYNTFKQTKVKEKGRAKGNWSVKSVWTTVEGSL
jgi:hypothetical protein